MRLYTPQEDRIIIASINQAIAAGEPAVRGLERAADRIERSCGIRRTYHSLKNRWAYILKKNSIQKLSTANIPYSPEEDVVVRDCILKAVLHVKKTVSDGTREAAKLIEQRFGRKRTVKSVIDRWNYSVKGRLSDEERDRFNAAVKELASLRLKKNLSASDIVEVAEKHNRNPIHLLGACGSINRIPVDGVITIEQVLQLTKEVESLRRQVSALRNLNRTLLAQLVSANKQRADALKGRLKAV